MEKQIAENPCISVRALRHFLGGKQVLNIDSLEIYYGRTYALAGHNGSGKTTLLRILAGLDKPFTGDIDRTIPVAETILCFQKPYMFKGTVRYNIEYGLKARRNLHGSSGGYKDIVERMGLESFLRRNACELSAGETQRVALVRALVCKPQVLILDEPTANLDLKSVEAIEKEIRSFSDDGGTVVLATHALESVSRLCATVIHLEDGIIKKPDIAIKRNL